MNPRKQNNGSDKKCQKVIHHIKWLKNKRAILVLVWSFCVFTCYNHFQSLLMGNSLKFVPLSIMIAFGLALFFPVGGWLADVYFGRYKVIHVNILIMWVSSILIVICYIMKQVEVNWDSIVNVSYTHLTLPTIYSV